MPLSDLVEQPQSSEPMPTQQPSAGSSIAQRIYDRLTGSNGVERYQLWPERVVRDAVSAPHDVMNSTVPLTSQDLIKPALDMSALAGTGGLAGAEAGTVLGSAPMLRPALKYNNKIYKAPIGGQHLDALPKELVNDFHEKAMTGEDISHYNFGFMNHKGQFLDRQKALDYAIENGLLDPHSAQYGALTSTMDLMADSSKPAMAFKILKNAEESHPDYVYHATTTEGANDIASSGKLTRQKPGYGTDQKVWPDGSTEKRNYFTPTASNSWQFVPEYGQGALLRIKKVDHPFKRESTGDLYSTKDVPASKIEYQSENGSWQSLKGK